MISPAAALEALLFVSGEAIPKKRLAKLLGLSDEQLATTAKELAEGLGGHGMALIETAEELELRTAPDAAAVVKRLREDELARDLGKGSLETLAVVAYQEGATRSEIDWVRGVNSSASLRTLLMRGLIEGHEDPKDKRRMRYTLTTEALAHLGIARAAELPRATELSAAARAVVEAELLAADAPATT